MDRIDEAVEVAGRILADHALDGDGPNEKALRIALLAGMKALLGPVVAEWRDSSDQHYAAYERTATNYNVDWSSKSKAESLSDCADQIESIYAPSLGEGDGR